MNIPNKYRAFPFWSWNDELDEKELVRQIDWMHNNGIGGFFMHARGGLTTPYLGEKWFSCIEACLKRAKELDMEAYAYDENGWPSGFVGGQLLEDEDNRDCYLTFSIGEYDPKSYVSYDISSSKLIKSNKGKKILNVFLNISTSTADILNKNVVKKFISLTHEEYKKHDIYGNLRGFFTDEPQYYRWDTPYTRVLPEYFRENYKEDIFDRLGLLFVEKEGYRDFRYKYYKAMQELMLNSFAKQIYDWCDKNNYKLTGHFIEENSLANQMMCCGGIMPFYEYEHIPGVDYLGRNVNRSGIAKQLGSVASQLGKEQRMAEIFACAGWDATPNELKLIAENLMVNGVNIICNHLLPYSEHGQRKRDYPEHYSNINPWVSKAFGTFNDYFAEIGMKLSKSKEIVNVGLFQPIRSAYFDYKHYEYSDPNNRFNLGKLDKAYLDAQLKLEKNHIPYHLLDETILRKHGSVDNSSLIVGLCKYDYIIIPAETKTMDKESEQLLREFIKNGGKILLLGEKPSYLEGNRFNYDYLKSNISFEEIKNNQEFEMDFSDDIIASLYEDENGRKYIYALNLGDETNIDLIVSKNKTSIHFEKYESKFIYLDEIKSFKENNLKPLLLGTNFKISKPVNNFITLDNVEISYDGINFSNSMNYMGAFNVVLSKKYCGDLYLRYNVDIKTVPSECQALIENTRTKEVKINGHVVDKTGTILEKDLWKYDIAKYLKTGLNEIIVKIDFYENDHVYYVLFGENVKESLKNCLAYDTTIEAIYLMGNFGVFGDFEEHEKTFIATNFYIDTQKEEIKTMILDGFPFFRGLISLEQEVEVNDEKYELIIPNRFQVIDVYVNNEFVDRLMFKNKCDLSKYLLKGKNVIRLEVVVSNRNLLGPHHLPQEEALNVGPNSWELNGSWDKNGRAEYCIKRYSFVKVI